MSERPNDAPDTQPDDLSGMPEPVAAEPEPAAEPEASMADGDTDPKAAEPEGNADDAAADPEAAADEAAETVEPDLADLEPVSGAPIRPMSPSERRAARAGLAHGQLPIDPSLRIKDRASSIFVLVTVGVFVAILLNALVFGHGGFLTPLPSPTPVPSITAAPTAAPASSVTAAPAPSVSAAPAPLVTAAPTAAPTVAPSASPAPS